MEMVTRVDKSPGCGLRYDLVRSFFTFRVVELTKQHNGPNRCRGFCQVRAFAASLVKPAEQCEMTVAQDLVR